MKTLLVTFGCSWTYGVGLGYTNGMNYEQYAGIVDYDEYTKYSFRNLLCGKYNLQNKNFSEPGSSNQKQFRLAKIFFSSKEFNTLQQNFEKIIVLWGITSTARNEMFTVETNRLENFPYSSDLKLAQYLIKNCYDHDNEIATLSTDMLHWNDFFQLLGVKNLWFDTFNHHDYLPMVEHMIFKNKNPRDLLSQLAIQQETNLSDRSYHQSVWKQDDNRLLPLVEKGILNPFSYHPTRLGHELIAEMCEPSLKNLLQQ